MKVRILIALVFAVFLNTFGQSQFEAKIYYPSAQSHLIKTHKAAIQNVLDSLPLDSNYQIVIRAYSDSIGKKEHNKILSQQRANGVFNFLKSKNVLAKNVKMEFYGEDRNFRDSEFLKPELDRLAVVTLILPKKDEVWEAYMGPRLRNFYKNSNIEEDVFLIHTDSDTTIRCSGGTLLKIKKNSLIQNNIQLKNQVVEFRIKEVFSKSEMILENLSTTSNDRILESAGMLRIVATLNEVEVKVLPEKPITIFMPSKTSPLDFKLFEGNRESPDSSINWFIDRTNLNRFRMSSCFSCWANSCVTDLGPEDCPFFFCKIRNFFNGLFAKEEDLKLSFADSNICPVMINQLESYGIENTQGTMEEILTPLFIKYDVSNYVDLIAALENEKMDQIELRIKDETVNMNDFNYYVFQRSTLGWINCDEFLDFEKNQLTNLNVKTRASEFTDVKLIFKNRNTILNSGSYQGYSFQNIPVNEEIWVIALKEEKGNMYLFMEETTTSAKTVKVNWEKVGAKELLSRLKILNI